MKRVAFIFQYDEGWLGGLNYFRNLISAIDGLHNPEIEAVIFVSSETQEKHLAGLSNTKIIRSRLLRNTPIFKYISRLFWVFTSRDILMERLLRKHRIDVISHSGSLGRGSKLPSIGWIPDFQYYYLPEFYQGDEVSQRIAANKAMCKRFSVILLSSHDAQKDMQKFIPEFAGKSRVLQFVANEIFDDSRTGKEELQAKYGFKGNYFLVCNQFWAHKNHRVIIEALHELRKTGREMLVLATGNTQDHRQPGFFNALMEYAKELNVEDCFKVLGIVPRTDLMGLKHGALALINPSLFEGWNSSVEEAKSLGKRIILSDLEVHREQNPKAALFFAAKDTQGLASAMWETYANFDPELDREMMIKAQLLLPQRLQDFAGTYQKIVLDLAHAG